MQSYDFIIVGAGSAGAVVTHRLSAVAEATVLVLEAGGTEIPPAVEAPHLWYNVWGTEVDWQYTTVPQAHLNDRVISEPRGKLIGGTSNLNLMMHVRGHPSDFDTWAYQGCPGWGNADVRPYFERMEDRSEEERLDSKGGLLPVAHAQYNDPNPTSQAFIQACLELGYPYCDDFNGSRMEGAGWHRVNVKGGRRFSARRAYLVPALERPNVALCSHAQVGRLLFDGKRCIGVEYVVGGRQEWAYADREVVVCAGAFESPKLLMVSGIGPGDRLRSHGISVVQDLPGVGENFHNHVLTGVIMDCRQPVPPPNLNMSESALFTKSEPGWMGPDLQLGFVHASFDLVIGQGHPDAISILPGVVRPMSRGWVRLASADPLDKPLINPNYLGSRADLERLVAAVKLSREIFAARAFADWVGDELLPGPDVSSDAQLEEFVRQRADSYHHQCGSCKMGLDGMAVVDPALGVHGIEGLRVADASVMPNVTSGNIHAAVLMIAEKCADMIKQAHGL